jgi:hypothetical protein
MPESGKYEKLPRPESTAKLREYLSGNSIVESVQSLDQQVILVQRKGKHELKIYLTNVYIIGIAEVSEIMALVPDNSYTQEAKEYCKKEKIGLFRFVEFLGAVYYDGDRFLNYIHPDDRR